MMSPFRCFKEKHKNMGEPKVPEVVIQICERSSMDEKFNCRIWSESVSPNKLIQEDNDPLIIYGDNQAAILNAESPCITARNKHFANR